MTVQGGMHDSTQCARAFSMDDPDVRDSSCETFIEIMRHKIFNISGRERVQVERAIDRQVELFIHQGE